MDYSQLEKSALAKAIGLREEHIALLLNNYIEESQSILSNLENAITTNDMSNIALYAHSLKGSSGNLHLDELYEQCKAMEFAAKDTNTQYDYTSALESIRSSIATLPNFS